MSLPGNGIFVVRGEMSTLMTAMRRGNRWSTHSHQDEDLDPLMKSFQDLKDVLNKVEDLRLLEPLSFLGPFLEVIKSEDTTGPVTSLSLSAINKFLSYGLIDPTHSSVPLTVHNIADAVTHARFVGTDQSSDGVVLMKILQVLRALTLAPEGASLTNESLCEIMLSCFKICFETRLSELLRRTAEHYLKDMVQLVFMRLPQFPDMFPVNIKQFKMRPGSMEQTRTKRKIRNSFRSKNKSAEPKAVELGDKNSGLEDTPSPATTKPVHQLRVSQHLSTTPMTPAGNIVDMQGSISQCTPQLPIENPQFTSPSTFSEKSEEDTTIQSAVTINVESPSSLNEQNLEYYSDAVENEVADKAEPSDSLSNTNEGDKVEKTDTGSTLSILSNESPKASEPNSLEMQDLIADSNVNQEYVNPRGIRFTPLTQEEVVLLPYGLACVRELFRFLISLCNPSDKQNTDVMIHLGLTLLTVAFEVGADSIGKYTSLMALVRDDLCRNLFSLLNTDRLSVFAANLQVSFLMFESLRMHLKFQLEFYLTKLIEIIVSDSLKATYEHKEIALDNILQLWHIPGLVTELYLNYDCDLYCTNLYEDLTKLLAKNAFPVTSGVYHTHLLSLDALLTVIESIEVNCNNKANGKCAVQDAVACNEGSDVENILICKSSRQKLSEKVPKREDLLAIKSIKRWLPTGTEYFNHKPKKGIQFLQEHGVLKPELDPQEIVTFLRENPGLDKKMIGEYISGRNNLQVLDAFVKMFDFTETRIDEALRLYLEMFRLPGEAPLISLLLEQFAEHWHRCNGEPFANADAAFTLAYAVIMLNVDQHNHNVKRQNNPMTADDFKKNLKKVNGGNEFDQDMLDEMYNAIKSEEIVMPAEQTGIVRENYLWKVLLRRGGSKDGVYIHVSGGAYDYDLFLLIWGPIVAALSFVFDKSEDPSVYVRAIQGFERCANISSHFGMTANLDMLILSLCKFTLLHNQPKHNNLTVHLGANVKARLALRTVFTLIHYHGDNVREGWKNVFDLILTLYSINLLPKSYVEAEDFIEPSGKIILVYEDIQALQKQESGLFSSLYSYMVSSENLTKVPTQEEQEYIDVAKQCLKDCNLEQLLTDSKFLHEESLMELVKALVDLSRGPDLQKALGYAYNENVTVFFLEFLVKIVIQNRDRVVSIWQLVRDHLYTLVMNASHCDYQFLLERSVIGLLRLAIRLMRNEEMSPIVLQSLRMLLLLKSATIFRISRQISFGLYELLKTSAQNIHTSTDWSIVFTLLECVGAGAQPPTPITDESQADQGIKSEGECLVSSEEESLSTDRGYTSDSELIKSPKHTATSRSQSPVIVPITTAPHNSGGGWILVGNEGEMQPVVGRTPPANQYSLSLERNLGSHDPSGLVKCCESLAFLVRDVAHITPYNFDDCVHCIRTFVEASLHEQKKPRLRTSDRDPRLRRKPNRRKEAKTSQRSPVSSPDEDSASDEDNLPSGYHQISIQLLDLMHTLHTRTAQIFRWWAEEGGELTQEMSSGMSLWTQGWCPLLQGIARLCCDTRRQVRMSAISYLQRALLVHDLQTLSAPEWEACFHRVLFPLLNQLLEPIGPRDPVAMEETRMRVATVLSKVFLHHLTPLLSLPTFSSLWLNILDFMDRYMHADKSDLLYEAIPESLKNMLLVMESAKVFDGPDGPGLLWLQTWDRISKFLPNMKEELFKEQSSVPDKEHLAEKIEHQAEDHPKPSARITQHNIENATRSSIILQPPSSHHTINSPLFAHLGQMVSTPIGPPTSEIQIPTGQPTQTSSPSKIQATPAPSPLPVAPIPKPSVPSYQPTIPYTPNIQNILSNIPNSQGHTFPVLYNPPPFTSHPTEVQPVSLYSEYVVNPYNITSPNVLQDPVVQHNEDSLGQSQNLLTRQSNANYLMQTSMYQNENYVTPELGCVQSSNRNLQDVKTELNSANVDVNKNGDGSDVKFSEQIGNQHNVFQSSNYFSGDSSQNFIPPGSEILFGTEQSNLRIGQETTNIPVYSVNEVKHN